MFQIQGQFKGHGIDTSLSVSTSLHLVLWHPYPVHSFRPRSNLLLPPVSVTPENVWESRLFCTQPAGGPWKLQLEEREHNPYIFRHKAKGRRLTQYPWGACYSFFPFFLFKGPLLSFLVFFKGLNLSCQPVVL